MVTVCSRQSSILAVGLILGVGCSDGPPGARPGAEAGDPAGGAGLAVGELVRHTVGVEGHPMALWERSPVDGGAGGDRAKAAVLLLHGRTWSTLPDFDLQVEGEDLSLMIGLAQRGFSVFGLDARGYGETPRDSTGWLTPDRAAADAAAVLEWIGERRPADEPLFLFGWSYGSMVAQLMVRRRPELVDGVILFGYPYEPDSQSAVPQAYPDAPPNRPTTAEAAASDFITPGAISQRAIDRYVEVSLEADPVRADWRGLEQWSALSPEGVTVPLLLLQGEFDPFAATEDQVELFRRLGTSEREWIVLAGGDHAALLETPRPYFIEAMVTFMSRPRAHPR